jgi:hypothetical protein
VDIVSFRPIYPLSRLFTIVLSSALVTTLCIAQNSFPTGTTNFVLDGNRMYAELHFVRPDGSVHKARVFVDMGSPSMTLTEPLFKELQLDQNKPLLFRMGDLSVEVPAAEVVSEGGEPYSIGSDLKVEGMLAAGVLQRFQVVIDYQKQTLGFTKPGAIIPPGISVPFRVDRKTGLIAVDASVDGKVYPITIDNGSAYTWVRQSTAKTWLVKHPEWERGMGAVGASNMMMSGEGTETSGLLLRIPQISLGSLILHDVGVLAAGQSRTFSENLDLFDWYSKKNAVPVIGWMGGNALKGFRLTIDYPNQKMYWFKQSDPDSHDLDQVGLVLRSDHGQFVIAAVAEKNGIPTVEGVSSGDRLVRIGALETQKASWGAIYDAMHGKPGETRILVLERDGHRWNVAAKVTAF